jgi:hypothetical protein
MLLLIVAATAFAYLPPATSILRRLGASRDQLAMHSLLVRGQYTFYGDEAKAAADEFKVPNAGGETTLPAELAYKMPGKCAITVQAPSGTASDAAITSNVSGRLKSVGPELTSLKVQAALACPLIDAKSSQHGDADAILLNFLEGLGVSSATVSLSRFENTIVYDIGAKPRDLSKPQFWVRKEIGEADRSEPLRLIANYEGKLYDVRLLDYTSQNTGEWHPREIDIYQGETLLAKFLADHAEPGAKISDAIF